MDDGGLSKFQRRMRAIPKVVREQTAIAVVKGAEEVADLQRTLVPVDDADLRESIEVHKPGQAFKDKQVRETQAIISAGDETAFYPKWVEFGTTAQPAQPFFFPAYRLLRKRVTARIRRVMNKAIREQF